HVLAAARRVCPGLKACPVDVRRPPLEAYTSHLSAHPVSERPSRTLGQLTTFVVPLPQVLSLRGAEEEVARYAGQVSYVATFALGGVPALTRLSTADWDRHQGG